MEQLLLTEGVHDKVVAPSPNPVGFATGGGPQSGSKSFAFEDGETAGEECFVLDKWPAARAVGVAVQVKKRLFLWDPRIDLPFFVEPEYLKYISIDIPEHYRTYASRVVENVPQQDEWVLPGAYTGTKDPCKLPLPAVPAEPLEGGDEELFWASIDVDTPGASSSNSSSSSSPPAPSLADRVTAAKGLMPQLQ